ncbi:hypothetical protein RRG08_014203 [Elysia crispata]|uniref:Uncharacterized protein n=1 Tax=Elysia crispata TaxID=231223 RepID=A0AAE0Z3X5_9GAST|nr:hypothetical protein RRG08_014203 [Elysia crispata]
MITGLQARLQIELDQTTGAVVDNLVLPHCRGLTRDGVCLLGKELERVVVGGVGSFFSCCLQAGATGGISVNAHKTEKPHQSGSTVPETCVPLEGRSQLFLKYRL